MVSMKTESKNGQLETSLAINCDNDLQVLEEIAHTVAVVIRKLQSDVGDEYNVAEIITKLIPLCTEAIEAETNKAKGGA